MINPSDVYTGYGFAKLYGCWTSNVTKFDTSSFYNWEQDNMPVLDLEERTRLLWERLGHPASSVDGVALVVSGDATDNVCNSNLFKTLSACLSTLPEVINCPYLIEVASYGDIGNLFLSNKTFGPRGSIEIINRNFSKGSPSLQSANGSAYFLNGERFGSDEASQNNGIASAVYIPNSEINDDFEAANVNYSSTPCIPTDFKLSKVLSLNQLVTSSNTYDSRITGNLTLFTKQFTNGTNRLTAALAATNPTQPFTSYDGTSNPSGLTKFTPHDISLPNPDNSSYDAVNLNSFSDGTIYWNYINTTGPAATLAYTNRLKQIKIYNCNGPIYIRNFTVDGEGPNGRDYGIDIKNSNVLLESCSVSRCNKAGLLAENSNVVLTRGFVAYRNYGFENNIRIGRPFTDKIKQENIENDQKFYSAGIELVNSELNLSSTFDRDFLQNISAINYFYKTPAFSGYEANSWLFCLSRNDIGIKSTNSTLIGGRNQKENSYTLSSLAFDFNQSNLICELNTEAGILLDNSKIDYSGRLSLLGNFRGINSRNSNLNVDQIVCKNNQKQGLLLTNSILKYNKDCYRPSQTYFTNTFNLGQLAFFTNAEHIKLVNSVFEPTDTSSMPSKYSTAFFGDSNSSRFEPGLDDRYPSHDIIVDSNSKLRLIGPIIDSHHARMPLDVKSDWAKCSVNGNSVLVNNNSELILQGTKDSITQIIGPSNRFPNDIEDIIWTLQQNKSGLAAIDNSKIKIQGPTVIANYGVDILADNNSNIEITPHQNKDGKYDVVNFDLNNGQNHTIVELHSSRSCIVVNNNSKFIAKDLGYY
ncbi:MAG: hypothetical protein RL348_110, partial [Bacteroidota bacterium]